MSGDGVGPRLARPAPAPYEETGAPGTVRRTGRPPVPGQRDPRFFAVLLGLLGFSAAVALAVPEPAWACILDPTAPALAEPPSTGAATAGPTAPTSECATPKPTPSPGRAEVRKTLPRIAAEPGQPLVAATPAKLTGSAVTMSGLHFAGIVDLPTTGGTLTALKFTVDHAVTDDVLLRSPGTAGRTVRFATDRLTVQGHVAFYATQFTGRLLGIQITLAPDLPLPDGIPITSPSPMTFTEPAIDLAFVTGDALTAWPKLTLALG